MRIKVIRIKDENLESLYRDYRKLVLSLREMKADKCKIVEQAKEKAYEIDEIVRTKYADCMVVLTEEYYSREINNVRVENLLMNGLYNSEKLLSLLDEFKKSLSEESFEFFLQQANQLEDGQKLLFWNL